jgi:hypothetical protein
MEEKVQETKAQAQNAVLIPQTSLDDIGGNIRVVYDEVKSLIDNSLVTADRLRKLGSGVRRYGFMDKVSDVAEANMEFAPKAFKRLELKALIRQIELLRNMSADLNFIQRSLDDLLLITGNAAFQESLLYYNSVREQARGRVPGAQAVFDLLRLFFVRPRRASGEPTEAQTIKDVKALLHGKKDGEIIIKNKTPKSAGAERLVVDETGKVGGHFKETEEGEIR